MEISLYFYVYVDLLVGHRQAHAFSIYHTLKCCVYSGWGSDDSDSTLT